MIRNYSSMMLIFTVFFCLSCFQIGNEEEKEFRDCVNQSTEFTIFNSDQDFYSMMSELEKYILNDVSKIYYKDLIARTYEDSLFEKKIFFKMKKLFDKYKYEYSVFNTQVLINCPYAIIEKFKLSKETTLYKQSMKIEKIRYEGYLDSQQLFEELIDITPDNDFQLILYRTPILLSLVNKMIISESKIKKVDTSPLFED